MAEIEVGGEVYEIQTQPIALRGAVRSGHWPKLRNQHLAAHPMCEACGDVKNHPKQVHHIVPVHFDPSRELDPTNLITFCDSPCHIIFGHLYRWQSQNPNVVEDSARMLAEVIASRSRGATVGELNYMEGTEIG